LRFGIGEIRSLHDYDGGTVIQTNAVFDSGASGGRLFNDKGELIGHVPDDPNARRSFAAACSTAGQKQGMDEARAALSRLHPD
jgi:S1-C subfamily serine protease